MTANVKTRKIDKLTVAAIIAVVALLVGMLVPWFHFPETVVYENSLIVSERTNMQFKSLLIDVVIIDENGKVTEEDVRVYLEGNETEYRFTQEDLKEMLQTEHEVYIKGLTDKTLLHCTFFTWWVAVLFEVILFVALISIAFVGIWGAERFLNNLKRVFLHIEHNLQRNKNKNN